MEAFGTASTILQTVDLCVKYGNIIYETCVAYQNAEQEIMLLLLRTKTHWLQMDRQFTVLRNMWIELDGDLQLHFQDLFVQLEGKLRNALLSFDKVIGIRTKDEKDVSMGLILKKSGKVNREWYAIFRKKTLTNTVEDLERWHTLFNSSWFILIRLPSVNVENEQSIAHEEKEKDDSPSKDISTLVRVRTAIAQSSDVKKKTTMLLENVSLSSQDSLFGSACMVARDSKGEEIVVDTMEMRLGVDTVQITADVEHLARTLSVIDSNLFNLLSCRGIIKETGLEKNPDRIKFLFNFPPEARSPRSFREVLLFDSPPPLNERFELALQLANSVMFLHNSRFVHKNIRPETAILFQKPSSRTLYLVGFSKFRPADAHSYRYGDENWEENLYRHPSRQGEYPEDLYEMRHDIYSLGVCLLEIGLWTSFVKYSSNPPNTVADILPIEEHLLVHDLRVRARRIKATLVEVAETHLPVSVGKIYTQVVLDCLKCLDKGDATFGPLEESDGDEDGNGSANGNDGIAIGVHYAEKVLASLQRIIT